MGMAEVSVPVRQKDLLAMLRKGETTAVRNERAGALERSCAVWGHQNSSCYSSSSFC
jgi:hypothetical protein